MQGRNANAISQIKYLFPESLSMLYIQSLRNKRPFIKIGKRDYTKYLSPSLSSDCSNCYENLEHRNVLINVYYKSGNERTLGRKGNVKHSITAKNSAFQSLRKAD